MLESRLITRILFFLCVIVWGVVAFQIVVFAASRFDVVLDSLDSEMSFSNGNWISRGDAPGYYIVWNAETPPEFSGASSQNRNWVKYITSTGSEVSSLSASTSVVYLSITRSRLITSGSSAGKYSSSTYRVYVNYTDSSPSNLPSDTDRDGVKDDIDPCPDSYDEKFKLWRLKNVCTGSYYVFQITGECGVTKTYTNPIYNSEKSAIDDASANPDCAPVSAMGSASMSAKDFENWYDQHHFDVNVGGAPPDEALPDLSIPDPTGGNSTVHIPPKPVDASDPDSQKVIDQIERMKVAVEQAIQFSGNNVAGQVQVTGDQIVSGLKGVKDAVNGLSMGGVSTAVNSAAATAHSDSQAMLEKLEEIKNKPVSNATASATLEFPSVSVSGSFTIPESGVLEPVSEDRVIAAKQRFMTAWDNLKNSFTGIFDVNLSGSGSLPVWTWPMLGQNVVIDFNEYSTQLNWIGLALLFIASVYAIFIVFGN